MTVFKTIRINWRDTCISILLCCLYGTLCAQELHPHILLKPSDKNFILNKIHQDSWAHAIFTKMVQQVKPYVEQHQKDRQWILSRYLMNWTAGKHYTHFYSDPSGTELLGYGGNAPYPTIRVSPHKRPPITSDGYSFKLPTINQLIPYDTSMKMYLQSSGPDHKWEWISPQDFVGIINGKINELVLDASIIYWLTGQTAYGSFAADILSQWARGAYYQQPITGPCRTGFLHIQSLGDDHTIPMILAYDFLYNFMQKKGYQTKWYQSVFEKIASTMTFRGYWDNNWFAAQTPALVFAALSLNNRKKRSYYLNFYLRKDTIKGACGQLALPSLVKRWLTPDGHWKETGGYHNYAIANLLESALAMEENGYPVFKKFPALFKASYVLLKYSFPNLKNPAFGDNGSRPAQNPECLEIALLMAKKYGRKLLSSQLLASMHLLIKDNHYQRQSSGYLGLLCFLPELPQGNNLVYTWPRSAALKYARCYLERNGMDSLHGLMYIVQGATYNHNHANGMAMELYGAGSVMGADPGDGLTYEAPLHVHYYAQWAAHNTVVADERSCSVPYFKGGGGAKQIGHIKLEAMEPVDGKKAVSPFCSFTDTRYTDPATGSKEQRTMAIIRTSDTSGYYIDIYRSSNTNNNEYLYHNIGDTLQLFTIDRKTLNTAPAAFPFYKKPFDPSGFSSMKNFEIAKGINNHSGIIARFRLQNKGKEPTFMQVLMPGQKKRNYYTALAPPTHTAPKSYRAVPTPVLICWQQGQAWSRPFIAVYEPYIGMGNYTVHSISLVDSSKSGTFTALKVNNKSRNIQLIFESTDSTKVYHKKDWEFHGDFGVISLLHHRLNYIYIGKGRMLSYAGTSVETDIAGAVNIALEGNSWKINCNQTTHIFTRKTDIKKIIFREDAQKLVIPFVKTSTGIAFTIPAVHKGSLQFIPLP